MSNSRKWVEARLGDLVKIKHGWAFKSELFSEEITGKPIIVSIGNFCYTGGFRFDSTTIKEYRGDYPPEYDLLPGDILLVMTCQTSGGEILGIPGKIPNDGSSYLHNQRLGKIEIKDEKKVDRNFLYWLFLYPEFNRHLYLSASGTKILHTSPSRIEDFKFQLPPIIAQKDIASVLDALNDKIELNRKMNETLEAMAKAMFKSWFVDFDPVRAKMEGREPVGMDTETTALFPDGFEESELGEIPRGWRVGRLGEIVEHIRRGVQPNKIEPEIPYIALEHMPRRCIALYDWGNSEDLESNKFQFKKGEILYGKLRPYFHKVGVAPVNGVCSTDIVVMAPKSKKWFGIVLGHVSSNEFVEYTNAGSTGTKMPRTNWNDMAHFEVVLPPEKLAGVFTDNIQPAVERIIQSIHESRTLAQIRDTLLPKLLSGEIRVGDAEKVIGSTL